MNRPLPTVALVSLVGFLATSAVAEGVSDKNSIDAGRKLALAVCSTCHVVAADQEFPPQLIQHTPSFEEIANRPNTTAISLGRFITTTHWDQKTIPMTMPNFMLMDKQKDNAISYILSLRRKRS